MWSGRPGLTVVASVALCWLVTLTAGQYPRRTTEPSGASSTCPCINPWAAGWSSAASATVRNAVVSVAPGYGASTCSAWDDTLHPECLVADGAQPGWCLSKWCYVDTANCARPNWPADTVWATASPAAAAGLDRSQLFVSYETCGFVNDYDDSRHKDTLLGQTYRVSFPGDSGSGYTLLTKDDGSKDGSVVQFMKDLKEETGFDWTIHEVADTSRSRYSSSFTACVHEVALGETDLCIGNFWMTNERLLLTPFTGLLYTDEFSASLSHRLERDQFARAILQVDRAGCTGGAAFNDHDDATASVYQCGVAMYMTVCLNLITGAARYNVPMWQEWPTLTAFTDYIAAKVGISRKHAVVDAIDATIGRVLDSTYYAALSFTNGHVVQLGDASEQGGTGVPEKIVTVGFAMFGLIILTAYTASSAAALVVDAQAGTIKNMQDLIDSGGNVCVRTAIEGMLLSRYPEMLGRTYTHDLGPALLDAMDEGECLATCLMADAWDNVLAQKDSPHCNKIPVGETLLTAGNAMPVSKSLHQSLSFIVGQEVAAGAYAKLREEYKKNLVGVPSCGEDAEAGEEGFQSLTELDLLAPLLITFISTSIGMLIYCITPSKTSKGRFTALLHAKLYRGEMSDEEKDAKLKQELFWRPMSDLLYRAQAAGVDRDQAAVAMNRAPDKTALVELVYRASCSEAGKDVAHLRTLPISSLVSLIRAYTPDPETAGDVINSISMIDLRRAFRVVDRDDSGEVNAEELDRLFEALGSGMSVSPATAEMIGEADKNGDGEIGFSEFVKIVRQTKTPEWYDAAKLAAMAAALDEVHDVQGALIRVITARPEIRRLARTNIELLSDVAEANAEHSLKVSAFISANEELDTSENGPDAFVEDEFTRLVGMGREASQDSMALPGAFMPHPPDTQNPSPRHSTQAPKEGDSRPAERPGGLMPGKNAP